MATPQDPTQASRFAADPKLTSADSKFVQQIPQMSEQAIFEQLGYGAAIQRGGVAAAEAEFRQNHNNAEPTMDKLEAVMKQAIYDKENFTRMGANGITAAQAYSITTAANHTGVPANNIAKLAIAERAFDSTYTARNGRQPGLIQMKETDFINTFAQHGGDCSRTADLFNQIPKDASGKAEPPTDWPNSFRDKVAKLQSDPLASAQLGALYAKTHPVQLDVLNAYRGETAQRNRQQLGDLMRNVGGLTNGQTNIVLNPSQPEWCAATVDSAMQAAGIQPRLETRGEADPGKPTLLAKDYDKFGSPVTSRKDVKPGDVVVFDSIPHVSIVQSVDVRNGTFTYSGGNQSSHYDMDIGSTASLNSHNLTFRHPPQGAFATAQSTPLPAPPTPDPLSSLMGPLTPAASTPATVTTTTPTSAGPVIRPPAPAPK
jgi:hypothetical protein